MAKRCQVTQNTRTDYGLRTLRWPVGRGGRKLPSPTFNAVMFQVISFTSPSLIQDLALVLGPS